MPINMKYVRYIEKYRYQFRYLYFSIYLTKPTEEDEEIERDNETTDNKIADR